MGYELEIKINFEGQGKQEGVDCAVTLVELCDDGSDPEFSVKVTKGKSP